MPHQRPRAIRPLFRKQLGFWPILCVLGPRQCGKTTFLSQLAFEPKEPFLFRSFDQSSYRRAAHENPEFFLKQNDTRPLILDEAHKVPEIFDEIKALVDLDRRPGQFILTGSVEFSKKTGILESFTGRAFTLRMDPLTFSESLGTTSSTQKSPNLRSALQYLQSGGMPGIFAIREIDQKTTAWEQWVEKTCQSDLTMISQGRLSGTLALDLLAALAVIPEPTLADLSKLLRTDARRVASHLDALQKLFVVRAVDPHPLSRSGKTHYHLFDPGLVTYLGGSLRRQWHAAFLLQVYHAIFAKRLPHTKVTFYRSRRGSWIDFAVGNTLHCFSELSAPDRGALLQAQAAIEAIPGGNLVFHVCSDSGEVRTKKLRPIETVSLARGLSFYG